MVLGSAARLLGCLTQPLESVIAKGNVQESHWYLTHNLVVLRCQTVSLPRKDAGRDFEDLEIFLPNVEVQDRIVQLVQERERTVRDDVRDFERLIAEVERCVMGEMSADELLALKTSHQLLPSPVDGEPGAIILATNNSNVTAAADK